jgi:hypothetical protein
MIGILLVNLSNTIGVILKICTKKNMRYAVLVIYKSYATCFLSGARGMWRFSHHLSITFSRYLVLIYRKMRLKLFSHVVFALTASKI